MIRSVGAETASYRIVSARRVSVSRTAFSRSMMGNRTHRQHHSDKTPETCSALQERLASPELAHGVWCRRLVRGCSEAAAWGPDAKADWKRAAFQRLSCVPHLLPPEHKWLVCPAVWIVAFLHRLGPLKVWFAVVVRCRCREAAPHSSLVIQLLISEHQRHRYIIATEVIDLPQRIGPAGHLAENV